MKSGNLAMLWYILNTFMLHELFATTFFPKPIAISDYGIERIIPRNPILPSGHDSRGIITIKPKIRRKGKLLRILDKDFNRNVMSITKPNSRNGSLTFTDYPIDRKMENAVRNLKINLKNINDTPIDIDSRFLESIKLWLVKKSSCPVEYTWDNLGDFFWPPWIRQGNCLDNGECSWPPGMHCIPARSKIIRILRWNCKHRPRTIKSNKSKSTSHKLSKMKTVGRRRNLRRRCRWEKVPYPIIDECFCSC